MIVGGHMDIKQVFQKCQSVAIFFHKSENNEVTLKAACKFKEIAYHIPVLAVQTQWNSQDDNARLTTRSQLRIS